MAAEMCKSLNRTDLNGTEWKEFYQAALLEDDESKLPKRIAEAKEALRAREDVLFQAGDGHQEQRAIENALYFLRILGNMGEGEPLVRAPHRTPGIFPQPKHTSA
jgi:hypothetical protein